jgi:hypothetical protein
MSVVERIRLAMDGLEMMPATERAEAHAEAGTAGRTAGYRAELGVFPKLAYLLRPMRADSNRR